MEILTEALASSSNIKRISKESKRTKEEVDQDNSLQFQFKSAVTKQQTRNISASTYSTLSPSEVVSARMTEVSYINFRDGEHAAQLYVKKNLPDYKWDRSLSTEHVAVFVDKNTGKVRVSARGTQTAYDWKTNARLATSTLGQSQEIKDMDKSINEVFDKYGKNKVEILSGHSKGGGTMFYFGEKYGIDTHLQDPAIPSNEVFGKDTKAKHFISKTPADIVSSHSNIAGFRRGINMTDLKPINESFKAAHSLDIMTGTEHKKKGNRVYNPEVKNKAYLISELQAGKTKTEIVKDIGYSSKKSRELLRNEIDKLLIEPHTHENILKESGFVTEKTTGIGGIVKEKVVNFVAPKADTLAGKTLTKIAKVGSAGGIAGILTAVGAGQALNAIGSENRIVNEGVVGALSNAGQDAAAAAYAQMRNRGHHIPITNALRDLPRGQLEQLLAEAEGTAAGTAETAITRTAASRAASVGTSALRSLTRGGVAGVLGVGAQMGTQAALQAMGVDEHAANIVSRLVGAAASGAVFGPVSAGIFTAIEGTMIVFEELWSFFSPEEPETSPFVSAQRVLQTPITESMVENEAFAMGASAMGPSFSAMFVGYQILAGRQRVNMPAVWPPPPPPPRPVNVPPPTTQFADMTPEEQAVFIEHSVINNRPPLADGEVPHPALPQLSGSEYWHPDREDNYDDEAYNIYDSNYATFNPINTPAVVEEEDEEVVEEVDEEVVEEEVIEVDDEEIVHIEEQYIIDRQPLGKLKSKHKNDTRAVIINSLNNNLKIQKQLKAGNIVKANDEIRNHFIANDHLPEFNGTNQYGDPHLPQLNKQGVVEFQTAKK